MNNLSDEMQKRLDEWRKHPLPVPHADRVRGSALYTKEQSYRRGDYGDDVRDYERKDAEQWEREFNSNPIYRRDV